MKKRRIKWLAYLLSISMSLTGCNALNKDNKTDNEIVENIIESSEEVEESKVIDSLEPVIEEKIIPLDPLVSEYMSYYDYDTTYYISNYVTPPISINGTKPECIYDGTTDANLIANQIKDNSVLIPTSYSNFFVNDYNLKLIASIIDEIKSSATNDINEDIHTISTIKIYYKEKPNILTLSEEDSVLAYYNDETNTLIINKYNIINMCDVEGKTYYEVLKQILFHEFNHIRQDKCSCRVFDMNDFEYTDTSMTFFKESSSESELYNIKDINYKEYSIYQYEREIETEIFLLALLNNKDISDYYNAIFDTNEEELYKFFSLNSEEDINDFNNIIYQIDALLYRNNYAEVESIYSDPTSYELSIGYNYKIEIFKRCINDLLLKTNNENISLEENLTLFNIIKNILIKNAYTYREEDDHFIRVTDANFISEFMILEETYIEFLSKYYNVSVEEIRDLETLEIKCIIVNINNIVNEQEVINYKDEEAGEILNKYPLLNNILNTNYIYQSNYETYLEDFNYKLTK